MMQTEISAFLKKKSSLILPFILDVILCTAIYSVYGINFISMWTIAVIGVCIVMYALCEFINRHNFIGGIIITILFMTMMPTFFRLIAGNDWGDSFQQWFLTGAEQIPTKFEYLLALLISFAPFFSVVTYYFTNVLYRMSFLTLTSLIPCAVYVKVLSEINNVYVCLIAILNVAILMTYLRTKQRTGKKVVGSQAEIISACVFVFVLLVVSSIIPKENDARYYDRFEELFMNSGVNVRLDDNYSLFSEFSGNADNFRDFANRRMYTLYGFSMPYFKRQSFDYYDFESDRWYGDEYYSNPYYSDFEWASRAQFMSLSELQRAIKAADGYETGFAEKYNLQRLASYEQLNDPVREIFVQPEDFGAIYYLSPARAINVEIYDRGEQIYVTRSGVFRNRQNPHGRTLGYKIDCFDEFTSRVYWFELGGADMDSDTSEKMLTELKSILEKNNDPLADNVSAFLDVHSYAEEYRKSTEDNSSHISDRIKELAESVTAGYTYDWEKAAALQNYFINSGYVYDIRYISDDTSPEHFLFESQRGSCSDFASAFVLMARSVGLTVRYAEGYVSDITSREGVFVVRDSGSHAYPEVYIQNMGWVVFEPTVPSDYNDIIADDGDVAGNINIDYDLVMVVLVIAGFILAATLAAMLLYPVINERRFMRRIANASPEECIRLVYGRISGKTVSKLIRRAETYTPYETAVEFNRIAGCDLTELAFMVERVVYGGENADDGEKSAAIRYYDNAVSAAKEYIKEKNKIRRKRIR